MVLVEVDAAGVVVGVPLMSPVDGESREAFLTRARTALLDLAPPTAEMITAGKAPGQTSSNDPVQYSCQRNYAVLSTDGYWNTGSETSTYGPLQLDGTTRVGQQDGLEVRPMYDGAAIVVTSTSTITRQSPQQQTASTYQTLKNHRRTAYTGVRDTWTCGTSKPMKVTQWTEQQTETVPELEQGVTGGAATGHAVQGEYGREQQSGVQPPGRHSRGRQDGQRPQEVPRLHHGPEHHDRQQREARTPHCGTSFRFEHQPRQDGDGDQRRDATEDRHCQVHMVTEADGTHCAPEDHPECSGRRQPGPDAPRCRQGRHPAQSGARHHAEPDDNHRDDHTGGDPTADAGPPPRMHPRPDQTHERQGHQGDGFDAHRHRDRQYPWDGMEVHGPQQTDHDGRGHQRVIVSAGHEVHDDQRIQHRQPQRLGLADPMALRQGRDRDRQHGYREHGPEPEGDGRPHGVRTDELGHSPFDQEEQRPVGGR